MHCLMTIGVPLKALSRLTRSGRCFTPEELEKQRKAKGKEGVDVIEEINKPVTKEETNEFLKLMKHSEYSVVESSRKLQQEYHCCL